MGRRYTQLCHLNDHEDAITAVAFSPQGLLLATGSLDGRLCVWNVQEGRLLYRHLGEHEISAIAWLPACEDELLFGTKRGNIVRLIITPVRPLSVLCPMFDPHYIQRRTISPSAVFGRTGLLWSTWPSRDCG